MRFRFKSERGASYSLPVVLILPLYLMFMLMVFEIGLLEMGRFSVQYAATQASRSAVAWHGMAEPEEVRQHAERTAWTALSASVGNRSADIEDAGPIPADATTIASSYGETYSQLLAQRGQSTTPESLAIRLQNAAARCHVEIEYLENAIRVTVTYRQRLALRGASRFLVPDGASPFEYPLTATVTLPMEPPVPHRNFQPDLTLRGVQP